MRHPLSVAISPHDHTRDLVTGHVQAEGLDLTVIQLSIEEILQRFGHLREWDVSEFSLAQYVALRSRDDESVVALPVFLSRVFRHGAVFVRPGEFGSPAQLAGRRVGIAEWSQTAGVWTRGILATEYGLDLTSVTWVQAGVNQPGRDEAVPFKPPSEFRLERRPDATLDALLRAGDIDAIISARAPRSFQQGDSVRLIGDHVAAERDWYRRTGVFPIMHVLVLRGETYRAVRWSASRLVQAFTEAARLSVERLLDGTASHVPLPWAREQLLELAGPAAAAEWWPYGVEPNRPTLQMFLDFAHTQGVAARPLSPEELFAPETTFRARV